MCGAVNALTCVEKNPSLARAHDWQANFQCLDRVGTHLPTGGKDTLINLHLNCKNGGDSIKRVKLAEEEELKRMIQTTEKKERPKLSKAAKAHAKEMKAGSDAAAAETAKKKEARRVAETERLEEVKATAAAKDAADALAAAAAAQARADTAAVATYKAALAAVVNPSNPGGMSIHSLLIIHPSFSSVQFSDVMNDWCISISLSLCLSVCVGGRC